MLPGMGVLSTMPGIAGVHASVPSPHYEPIARRMVATMRHQPASTSGMAIDPELGIYAGWVAHEGSFAARQSSREASVRRL